MRDAGMRIVCGVDNDADAAASFSVNFPEARTMHANVADLEPESVAGLTAASQMSLFCGCAPCQPFSRQRTAAADPNDARRGLLHHLLRFVEAHRPEFVFVENVPGLRDSSAGSPVLSLFTERLQVFGYWSTCTVVRAQDYGVPQRRARLMLLASLLGPVEMPAATHGPQPGLTSYETVAAAIRGLPPIAAGETHPGIRDHRAARLSPLNLRRIQATPSGGGWKELPPQLRPASRRSFSGFTDVYGRLRWDTPAPALTTRCISYSNGRFGHPEQHRALSVREAARLQTFPDWFVFEGSLNSRARQIGNAVPPLLARRVGAHLNAHAAQPQSV